MKRTLLAASFALLALTSCSPSMKSISKKVFSRAQTQFEALDARLPLDATPRTFYEDSVSVDNNGVVDGSLRYWCSGFFPGSLWYLYEATGNSTMKALAEKNTIKLAGLCELKTDHDIGFQVNCSFGNAYRVTGDSLYLPVIRNAAVKLAQRYSPVVGCIKSWDKEKFKYPVIIDNMMNLELLMNASQIFDCDSLRDIAISHANTTLKNHFREDYSSFHLVDYDPETGAVDHKQTVQGYADCTAWSRGQAWGLYGYTMMYEKTGKSSYLAQAEHIAGYILAHLPKDGIPYWDFNAPGTPDAVAADSDGFPKHYEWTKGQPVLRDASAGAIMASALISLSRDTADENLAKKCLKTAKKQIRTLAGKEYLAEAGTNGDFLLKHSVGNLHGNKEVDVPLTYADYYYLEAILKVTGKL